MQNLDDVKRHFRFVIEPQIRPMCGPIFFTGSRVDPAGVVNSGSFGLVDTGKKKLLVTCWHVWEGFKSGILKDPKLEMCLGVDNERLPVFSPEKPIDMDKDLDIAVFDMEPFLSVCGHSRFYPLTESPPEKIKGGDPLVIIGFPGHYRQPKDGVLHFGRNTFAIQVSGFNDDGSKFLSDLERAVSLPPALGGISGSPCYLYRPPRQLNLVGFSTGVWMNVLSFTHARCLNADGTITKRPETTK